MNLLDTDKQGTAYELLERQQSELHAIRHVPVSDRFDGLSMVTVDSLMRRMRIEDNSLTIVDTGGWMAPVISGKSP